MADPLERETVPGDRPPPIAPTVVAVYSALAALGWVWLWLRGRTDRIAATAVGTHGIWASAAAGVAAGLAATVLLIALERYLPPFSRLRARLRDLLGPLGESDITVLALFSGLGEEFFFRLAMLDAVGLYWSTAIFGLLHLGPGGLWLSGLTAAALGLVFGSMVLAGWGLLSVTTAHALVNYISLRRMDRR